MITLPKRKSAEKTHCSECKDKLTAENKSRWNDRTNKRCKPCYKAYMKTYNDKRKKILANNKLW